MARVKRFFLKILLAIIVIGMIAGLACILINSRVVNSTEDKIVYTVTGEVEIKQFAVENIKKFNDWIHLRRRRTKFIKEK